MRVRRSPYTRSIAATRVARFEASPLAVGNILARRMLTTERAQSPAHQGEPSDTIEHSSSQVAVLESGDLLATIFLCIFDQKFYMTAVHLVSKTFHNAFHQARAIHYGYRRRTNPLPPPRQPLPVRLGPSCNGQELMQRSSKLLPLLKAKFNLTLDDLYL